MAICETGTVLFWLPLVCFFFHASNRVDALPLTDAEWAAFRRCPNSLRKGPTSSAFLTKTQDNGGDDADATPINNTVALTHINDATASSGPKDTTIFTGFISDYKYYWTFLYHQVGFFVLRWCSQKIANCECYMLPLRRYFSCEAELALYLVYFGGLTVVMLHRELLACMPENGGRMTYLDSLFLLLRWVPTAVFTWDICNTLETILQELHYNILL